MAEFAALEPVDPRQPHSPANSDVCVIVAISFKQLVELHKSVRGCLSAETTLIGYVFDAYFSEKTKRIPPALQGLTPYFASLQRFDRIYTPFAELIDEQIRLFSLPMHYLAIGVDALNHGGWTPAAQRFVTVNGYGRQPAAVVEGLADRLNRGGHGLFHFTSHVRLGEASDPARHRDLFWQTLRHSRIALAYSPESCDPDGRFPCSFLGQRWYESLAAGCVVAGKRPRASEVSQQLDWPDATIELPDNPDEAVERLLEIAEDAAFVDRVGRRNYVECLQRHDWRWRIMEIWRAYPMLRCPSRENQFRDDVEARLMQLPGA